MALVVNTNVSSLNAQRQLNSTTNEMSTAMERLSSGKRINTAADDAAGLAISTRMTSQVKGLTMAIRNANDGISLVQTAEGALQETTNMLQRMRELSVQASNSTSNDSDRASLNDEVTQLKAEIDRIATTTRFNNQIILAGSYSADLQIGDQADQTLSFGVSAANTASMGETADGLAEAATAASLELDGVSVDPADYAGKSFTVTVNGVDSTVTLPQGPVSDGTAVTVALVGDDRGPATSTVIGNQDWTPTAIDFTDAKDRVFQLRNANGEASYVNVDFSEALAAEMGVTLQELETGAEVNGVKTNETSADQLVAAIQASLDAKSEFQGENSVVVSLDDKGALQFTDANGRANYISVREGETTVGGVNTAGTFIAEFVDEGITTGEATAIFDGLDFSTTDNLSVFKANVNSTGYVDVDFLDKLNDTSIVKDRSAVFAHELVNAIQAELDELFTGDNAVTVGMSEQGEFTFSVAGGARTIAIDDTNYTDGSGVSVASNFAETVLVGQTAEAIIHNDSVTIAATGLTSITEAFENDDYVMNVTVNGGEAVDIDMAPYMQASVADITAVQAEEVLAALQAAFDANFSGENAVTVTLTEDAKFKFDVAGGVETLKLTEANTANDSTVGTFVSTFIGDNGTTGTLEFNENALATTGAVNAQFGDISYGSYVSQTASTTAVEFLNDERGYELGGTQASGSRMVVAPMKDSTTAGMVVDATSNATLTVALDGGTARSLTIDAGLYSNLQELADSINSEISQSGLFEGDNAVAVSVASYTDEDNITNGAQDYLVVSNEAGKRIELAGNFVTYSSATQAALFGTDTDSLIDSTKLFQELGIEPDTSDAYRTHDRVDGGVDTTVNNGLVSVSASMNGNTYSYQLAMTQDEATSFSDFTDELVNKANDAFAAQGISFVGSLEGSSFSLSASGDSSVSFEVSGAIADDAFGGTLSATPATSGNFTSMEDVVAAINEDLAGAEVSFNATENKLILTDVSGTVGAESTITVTGDDLADVQIVAESQAVGSASNATGTRLSDIDVSTSAGAASALASIDNAIEYISSQRSQLGAVENRLNHTINNLSNVVENTSASRSRIEDADFAVEAANLAKAQVMQQAGTAMLAQANASAQSVLSLLG